MLLRRATILCLFIVGIAAIAGVLVESKTNIYRSNPLIQSAWAHQR